MRVDTSEAKAVRLQEDHGGWNNEMKKVCTNLRATLLNIRLMVRRIHVCAYLNKKGHIHIPPCKYRITDEKQYLRIYKQR